MEIFLRCVADPGFQIGVSEEEGVHRTTVCKIFNKVLNKIVDKSAQFIKFPKTENEILEEQDSWYVKYHIPYIVGALDCTHIKISRPSQYSDEFINRKGYHSLNVQATCNSVGMFTSIDAQWPGSVQDSRIFKLSDVNRYLKNQSNMMLLADMGYGITPWCLTTYKVPRTQSEENFNVYHKRARLIIERCFGQLKKRFPLIGYLLRVSEDKRPSVVIACAVLHNMAKKFNDDDDWYDQTMEEESDDNEEFLDDSTEVEANESIRLRGNQIRNAIAQSLLS